MRYDDPQLRQLLAGEYVLGALQGAARRRFEALMVGDPALRSLADQLASRLAPLSIAMPADAPRVAVWTRVEQRLGFSKAEQRAGLFARLRNMGMGWAVAGVVAGLMVGQLVPRLDEKASLARSDAQLPASYVGVLSARDGTAGMLVSSLRYGRIVDVKLLRPDVAPEGSNFFLWGLPVDGGPAIPLGAIPQGQKVRLTMHDSSEVLLSKVSRLGVTAERIGIAPTTPTEPYLYLGFCGKFWL